MSLPGTINRRTFLQSAVASAAVGAGLLSRTTSAQPAAATQPRATADAMILIWLPGGVGQTDCWDPKKHTPYTPGMKGSEMLGTCPIIPTAAEGIQFGAGLENIASVMDKGTVLRSLISDVKFGAIHLKAQYYAMTGYLFPAGVKAPSMGAVVARALGRRDPHVPAYIDVGRDVNTSNEEFLFIDEYQGPGFYGPRYAPFMIPEPAQGMPTLSAVAGMDPQRLDRRHAYLRALSGLAPAALRDSNKAAEFTRAIDDARAMMDSPAKKAFAFMTEEKPELIAKYDVGHRFGMGCLLARRLVEAGARFVEVEYQYAPFKGFDTHESGSTRLADMKKQIDRPIAQLVRDLHERGMLDRTLVVVATEFGRTIANQPSAGVRSEEHTSEL